MFTKIIIISVVAAFISLFVAERELFFKYLRKTILFPSTGKSGKLIHINELKEYNGIEKPELYLVILGKIYNVTKGWNHYGPNQSYHVFVGNFEC